MKQTAVGWLEQQLFNKRGKFNKSDIEQAKEMEKLEKNNYICIKCKCKIDEEMHKVSD